MTRKKKCPCTNCWAFNEKEDNNCTAYYRIVDCLRVKIPPKKLGTTAVGALR